VCLLIGKSLLWVAILGLIVFYIYALVSFALLRSSFDPDSELYCATLWQCTITVIRYGLVGDLFDVSDSCPLASYGDVNKARTLKAKAKAKAN